MPTESSSGSYFQGTGYAKISPVHVQGSNVRVQQVITTRAENCQLLYVGDEVSSPSIAVFPSGICDSALIKCCQMISVILRLLFCLAKL